MKQIGTDFQGWPIKAMSLKDILLQLGFEEDENGLSIKKDNPLLDPYPRLLIDDGMGYGVDAQFVVETDIDVYDVNVNVIDYVENKDSENGFDEVVNKEKVKVFNVFRDVPEHNIKDGE